MYKEPYKDSPLILAWVCKIIFQQNDVHRKCEWLHASIEQYSRIESFSYASNVSYLLNQLDSNYISSWNVIISYDFIRAFSAVFIAKTHQYLLPTRPFLMRRTSMSYYQPFRLYILLNDLSKIILIVSPGSSTFCITLKSPPAVLQSLDTLCYKLIYILLLRSGCR